MTSYVWQLADLITTLRGLGYRIYDSRTLALVTSLLGVSADAPRPLRRPGSSGPIFSALPVI